jgi:hypothetical protein
MAKQKEVDIRRDKILDGLRGLSDANPIWIAVTELLQHDIERADLMTTDRDITPDQRTFCAGSEWALKQFRSALLIMRAEAQKPVGDAPV